MALPAIYTAMQLQEYQLEQLAEHAPFPDMAAHQAILTQPDLNP